MVVAMVSVWVMQMAIDQVVDVVAMRHSRMSAILAMNVTRLVPCTLVRGSTSIWIGL